MARRRISDQIEEEPIEFLTKPPRRDRTWEEKQRKTRGFVSYRGIPKELQEELKAVATDLGVPVGDIARRFIEFGLQAYQSGALELEPQLVKKRYSLYPDK